MRTSAIGLTLSQGRRLDLRAFHGEPFVLALFARAGEIALSDDVLTRLRAELRGLGAALVLISPDGAWCFRPDDELELLADREELSAQELAKIFDDNDLLSEASRAGNDRAIMSSGLPSNGAVGAPMSAIWSRRSPRRVALSRPARAASFFRAERRSSRAWWWASRSRFSMDARKAEQRRRHRRHVPIKAQTARKSTSRSM
jgi:hypothetical protein